MELSVMTFCIELTLLRTILGLWRPDTNTRNRGRTSYVLIGCERSEKYKAYKKDLVRTITGSKKCEYPIRLRAKLFHNHALAKSLFGHPYVGRLTKDEKIIIGDMTKSMVKPKNILLTLKEHNSNNSTTMKQVYNVRYAYRSSIRGNNSRMQQLIKLLEWDQYIHWHRLMDEDVVHDIFWSHLDIVKLTNAYNLVFLIDSTYKTNRYRLPLDPTWALERFRGNFLRRDTIPQVIVTDKDSALMNVVKTIFLESTNLLCRFHINKNVKTKCKTLVGKKKCMRFCHGSIGESGGLVESAHWALKRLLQNSLEDLCSVWEAMNNMITLQHTEIKTYFETSTYVVGHVFKVTLYKKLFGMISRYALNQIAAEFERLNYVGIDSSRCGCIMRATHSLSCACKLARYVLGSIPLDTIHMFWQRLSFLDLVRSHHNQRDGSHIQAFEELNVCDKVTLKSKLRKMSKQRCSKETDEQTSKINEAYHEIAGLLVMDEDSWSLVRNHLLKELAKWSDKYMHLLGSIDRYEELKGQSPRDSFVHLVICIGHVYDNRFFRYFKEMIVPCRQQLCYGQHIVIIMQNSGLLLILVECISIPI
ncbi:hypothetical protein HKD37_20G056408 [Glycine soja]